MLKEKKLLNKETLLSSNEQKLIIKILGNLLIQNIYS